LRWRHTVAGEVVLAGGGDKAAMHWATRLLVLQAKNRTG
jgi:hypothetical protein